MGTMPVKSERALGRVLHVLGKNGDERPVDTINTELAIVLRLERREQADRLRGVTLHAAYVYPSAVAEAPREALEYLLEEVVKPRLLDTDGQLYAVTPIMPRMDAITALTLPSAAPPASAPDTAEPAAPPSPPLP